MIFKENISSYNDSFIVPKKGIFELIKKFLYRVKYKHKILYNMKIVKIDIDKKSFSLMIILKLNMISW